MNRKLKKFIKSPGIFFRDYLNKRYPVVNCEQGYIESEEPSIFIAEQKVDSIEANICCPILNEVDAVFTWVNDKDPQWLSKKNFYLKNIDELGCQFSADPARFEDHNELYYSVMAVKKNLPWIRKIFIITDNQKPQWLCDDPEITLVDHTEIIDKQYLPTFNSHVIEANLHRINGLSENFIYFNDDVCVAKPVEKSHFFRKNGLASLFLSIKSLNQMAKSGMTTATLRASQNSKTLITTRTGFEIDTPLVHTYVPLKKSTFENAWNTFEEEIENFLSNRFRGKNDLNMATFLVPWLMYIEGKSIVTTEICYYFNIRSNHAEQQYKKLLAKQHDAYRPHSFCLNDVSLNTVISSEQASNKLENFLKNYFRV